MPRAAVARGCVFLPTVQLPRLQKNVDLDIFQWIRLIRRRGLIAVIASIWKGGIFPTMTASYQLPIYPSIHHPLPLPHALPSPDLHADAAAETYCSATTSSISCCCVCSCMIRRSIQTIIYTNTQHPHQKNKRVTDVLERWRSRK